MQNSRQSGHSVGWPEAQAAWHDVRKPTTSGCGGYLHRTACGCLQARKGYPSWVSCPGDVDKNISGPQVQSGCSTGPRDPTAAMLLSSMAGTPPCRKGAVDMTEGMEYRKWTSIICDASCFAEKPHELTCLAFLNLLTFLQLYTSCQYR